jgi:hypothetical protein
MPRKTLSKALNVIIEINQIARSGCWSVHLAGLPK